MTTNLEAVAALAGSSPVAATTISPPVAAPVAGASFGELVSQGLQQVNQGLMVSQADLQQLASGQAPDLHQVMMRLEESRLSFQLLMQVRGRLLEAYQDVMKMQV